MDPWRILQLEATDDTRAIKRAYARLLKTTRPDESPEAFQALHAAYKAALKGAETATGAEPGGGRASPQPRFESETHELAVTEPVPPGPVEAAPVTPAQEPERVDPPPPPRDLDPGRLADSEFERLLGRCRELLDAAAARNTGAGRVTAWQFLAESPWMLDSAFQHCLGDSLLQLLLERQDSAPPDEPLLHYLNQLFDWQGDRAALSGRLGRERLDLLLAPLDSAPSDDSDLIRGLRGGEKVVREVRREETGETPSAEPEELYFTVMGLRLTAMILDWMVIAALVGGPAWIALVIYSDINGTDQSNFQWALSILLGLVIPVYLVMAVVMEGGRWQATPGKRLLGLKVTDRNFQPLSFTHNLWRVVCFVLIHSFTALFVVVINVFLGGNLLHDRISRSYLINQARSEREHRERQRR